MTNLLDNNRVSPNWSKWILLRFISWAENARTTHNFGRGKISLNFVTSVAKLREIPVRWKEMFRKEEVRNTLLHPYFVAYARPVY